VSLTPLKELMILGTLRAHPMHGYSLVTVLDEGFGWSVGLTRPTVYATLKRFVERGWIEGEASREQGYPEREVYHVTTEGSAAHEALLQRCLNELTEGTYPVAAVLAHLDGVDEEQQKQAIERMLKSRQERLTLLLAFPDHDGFAGHALMLLIQHLRLEVECLLSARELSTSRPTSTHSLKNTHPSPALT
jgi:DNA-binding PadR family transcriptional regulator